MRLRIIISYAVGVALWGVLSHILELDNFFLPDPLSVFLALTDLIVGKDLYFNVGITFARLITGLGIATIVGLPLGFALGLLPKVRDYLLPIVDFARSIPVAMLFPVFIALFGLGWTSKTMIVAFFAAPLLAVSVMVGMRPSKDQQAALDYLELHKAEFEVHFYLIARAWRALPSIFTGARLSISLGLVVVIVTEMFFVASAGLGWAAFNSYEAFNFPEMYAYIFFSGLLGYGLNLGFDYFSESIDRIAS